MEFSNRRGLWFAFGEPFLYLRLQSVRRRLLKHNRSTLLTFIGLGLANEARGNPGAKLRYPGFRSPKLVQEIKPPARCRWLSPHRSVSGHSVTATTQVFVADLRLAQPDLLRSRLAQLISFVLVPVCSGTKSFPRCTQCRPSISCF